MAVLVVPKPATQAGTGLSSVGPAAHREPADSGRAGPGQKGRRGDFQTLRGSPKRPGARGVPFGDGRLGSVQTF